MSVTMKVIVNQEKVVDLSAALMAEVFWGMDSDQQAEFFHELAGIIESDSEGVTYAFGEMQWLYMTEAIKKRSDKAKNMFLAFSAFAYDFWPQKSSF